MMDSYRRKNDKKKVEEGCGGGVVVSAIAFYSDDLSSNLAGY